LDFLTMKKAVPAVFAGREKAFPEFSEPKKGSAAAFSAFSEPKKGENRRKPAIRA
jgi:hypothetical protein